MRAGRDSQMVCGEFPGSQEVIALANLGIDSVACLCHAVLKA